MSRCIEPCQALQGEDTGSTAHPDPSITLPHAEDPGLDLALRPAASPFVIERISCDARERDQAGEGGETLLLPSTPPRDTTEFCGSDGRLLEEVIEKGILVEEGRPEAEHTHQDEFETRIRSTKRGLDGHPKDHDRHPAAAEA